MPQKLKSTSSLTPPSNKEIDKFLNRMLVGVREPEGTEAINPKYANLDIAPNDSILDEFTAVQVRAIAAVHKAKPDIAKAAQAMIERLGDKGRIIYVGAGTSGRLGAVDGMELGPTFDFDDKRVGIGMVEDHEFKLGTSRDGREDDLKLAEQNMKAFKLTPSDVVICLAASGKTPYTRRFAQLAREQGSLIIGIANNYGAPLLEQDAEKIKTLNTRKYEYLDKTGQAISGKTIDHPDVDIPILLETGSEVIRGSTRMAAGTAQKVALTELTSLVMAKLPGVYGFYKGQMPNMRDANEKLVNRNAKMVADFANVALETAKNAVQKAMDFFVDKKTTKRKDTITKEATLIALGASEPEAEKLLKETKRDLRTAIELQKTHLSQAESGMSFTQNTKKKQVTKPAPIQPAAERNADGKSPSL